jgi:hypothetical protein
MCSFHWGNIRKYQRVPTIWKETLHPEVEQYIYEMRDVIQWMNSLFETLYPGITTNY